MLDFSNWLDLPMIWAGLIALAIFMYVILDGFDLGVGLLFPFAPSDKCRSRMMNSIAPFWDGNETWLVLGGGGLLAAFPLAYSIILPAYYMPIIVMLIGLILRGVAFEFRFKADESHRKIWDVAFHIGSFLATFMQGMILGDVIQGVDVTGRSFSGSTYGWFTPYGCLSGIALMCGYALLASTWLILKTEGETQAWAKAIAKYALLAVYFFMVLVGLCMIFINHKLRTLWFSVPNIYFFGLIPLAAIAVFGIIWKDLKAQRELRPFLLSMFIFVLGFIGLATSVWPWAVPYHFTIEEAAAASTSLSVMLIGVVIMLPIILAYTAYSYYVFRGKSSHETLY